MCVKMYGGGMGDQIKRYCEKLEHEDYEELRDNEVIYHCLAIKIDNNLYNFRPTWQMTW